MSPARSLARCAPFVASLLLLTGCGESTMTGTDAGTTPAGDSGTTPGTDGGGGMADAGAMTGLPRMIGPADRPAQLVTPTAHDGVTALPVLVLLHGYGASGSIQDGYLGLSREARDRGVYMIIPDGTTDTSGRRFWNATPACCDFGPTGVDDVAYITGLLDELEGMAPVSDILFMGHSNGGFMSYRMACELAPRISAIASLAGSDYANETDCEPSQPVSVLQIHGDLDETIGYAGVAGAYPSAPDAVARWAGRAGCDATSASGDALDLETSLAGAETTVERYTAGCGDAEAELWTIEGGGHIPSITDAFAPSLFDWLLAHRRSTSP